MGAANADCVLETAQSRLVWSDIRDDKLEPLGIDGGEVWCRRAAYGSGLEPRVDETVEIGNLINRVAADLPIRDRPASKGVDLDRLAEPPARVSRRLVSQVRVENNYDKSRL